MTHMIDHDAKRNGAIAVLMAGPGHPLAILVIVDSFADEFGNFWASTNSEASGALNLAVGDQVSHPSLVAARKYLEAHAAIQKLRRKVVAEIYFERGVQPPVNANVYHITGYVAPCGSESCVCKKLLQVPVKIFYLGEGDLSQDSLHKDSPLKIPQKKEGSKQKKQSSPQDERSKHPAIQAFRDVHKTYPQRSPAPAPYSGDWWDAIIVTVGQDDSAIAVWADVLKKWTGISQNKFNIDRQLALFRETAGFRAPLAGAAYPDYGDPGNVAVFKTLRQEQAGELGISDEVYEEWSQALKNIKPAISPEAYRMIESSNLVWVEPFVALVIVQTPSASEWVSKRLDRAIQRELSYDHPAGITVRAATYEEALQLIDGAKD